MSLCNYGIEYIDDPATAKKVPTCHRASFEKLANDENFNMAMEYADVVAQKVYRDEARKLTVLWKTFSLSVRMKSLKVSLKRALTKVKVRFVYYWVDQIIFIFYNNFINLQECIYEQMCDI